MEMGLAVGAPGALKFAYYRDYLRRIQAVASMHCLGRKRHDPQRQRIRGK